MHGLPFILLLFATGAFASEGPDALDAARRLADSGASQLALSRVTQSQPRDSAAHRWAEWETLRLQLLLRTSRHDELLQRVAALPQDMPRAAFRDSLRLGGRAAIALRRGELARSFAARALWRTGLPADAREPRLQVIESLAVDGYGEAAFHSMLRFQQDYHPLDRDTATLFVETLLDLGMAREALNWLGNLDEASPARQLLRLQAGLVSADAAIAQARAALAKQNVRGHWRVIQQAALRQPDRMLQIEALENLLHLADPENSLHLAAGSGELWQLYLAVAQEAGNSARLLTGDDASWADFAARRLGSNPSLARAVFAYLARHGLTQQSRHNAQLQLVFSLDSSGLDFAALRLFQSADADAGTAGIDAQAAYLLGAIAERHNLPSAALHFWRGLAAPPAVGSSEWRLRTAMAALRSGITDDSIAVLRDLGGLVGTLRAESLRHCTTLAQELLDAGRPDLAAELFEALLPVVDATQRRTVNFGLGRVNDLRGQPHVAADYYLRAALQAETRIPDALALRARQQAALSLARAGYRNDARVQFEWLIKNSKDAAQLEFVRQELKKL